MPEKPDLDAKPPAAARSLHLKFHFENAPLCPECSTPLAFTPWLVIGGVAVCLDCSKSPVIHGHSNAQLCNEDWACNHVRMSHGIMFWTPHTTSGRPITILDAEQFLGGRNATHKPDPLPHDLTGYEPPDTRTEDPYEHRFQDQNGPGLTQD